MPAIRPLNSISITAEMPISMPPMVEASGVNCVATAAAYSSRGKGSIQSDKSSRSRPAILGFGNIGNPSISGLDAHVQRCISLRKKLSKSTGLLRPLFYLLPRP